MASLSEDRAAQLAMRPWENGPAYRAVSCLVWTAAPEAENEPRGARPHVTEGRAERVAEVGLGAPALLGYR